MVKSNAIDVNNALMKIWKSLKLFNMSLLFYERMETCDYIHPLVVLK
jgi:hypothetical protein